MKFFGVHIEDLESERFLSASNDQIATWLFLHALCSKQMNGGSIAEASSLPERFWSRHGVSVDIINKPSPLWSMNGDDLTVEPYDIGGEEVCRKKSQGGKKGMAKRWHGTPDKSLNKSLNRPNPTLPNPTLPNPTLPKKNRSKSVFERPTLELVNEYGATLTPPFTTGTDFMDYYDSNGWKIGSASMKDWKATVRRWNRNPKSNSTTRKPKHAGIPQPELEIPT